MLLHRIISALILIPLVVLALFFLPMAWYCTFLVVIIGLSAFEWTQFAALTSALSRYFYTLFFVMMALLFLFFFFFMPESRSVLIPALLYLGLAWWILATILVLTYPKSALFWSRSKGLITLFGLFTLMPFFVAMIQLRLQLPMMSEKMNLMLDYRGGLWVLSVLVLIWATDTGAYFAGRALGKHKMAPAVSPKKTIEGLMGGLILALIIAALIYFCTDLFAQVDCAVYFTCAFFAIVISVLGDLTESMFKREAKIKDSGKLIPGHGGILDRIDSVVAAIPVFVALFYLMGS